MLRGERRVIHPHPFIAKKIIFAARSEMTKVPSRRSHERRPGTPSTSPAHTPSQEEVRSAGSSATKKKGRRARSSRATPAGRRPPLSGFRREITGPTATTILQRRDRRVARTRRSSKVPARPPPAPRRNNRRNGKGAKTQVPDDDDAAGAQRAVELKGALAMSGAPPPPDKKTTIPSDLSHPPPSEDRPRTLAPGHLAADPTDPACLEKPTPTDEALKAQGRQHFAKAASAYQQCIELVGGT